MSSAGTTFKVVLLGEGSVGKTSLVTRYVQNQFNEKHVTTIQASFLSKRLNLEGQRVTLNIWDTAGQERFHALGPIYYRDSNGALLVYDITDNNSFDKVQTWVKELRKMLGKSVCIAIVGNKCDLERIRAVNKEDAERYAASVGAKHYLTSAKLNKGLDDLFLDITRSMLQQHQAKNGPPRPETNGTGGRKGSNNDDVLRDFERQQNKGTGGTCNCG